MAIDQTVAEMWRCFKMSAIRHISFVIVGDFVTAFPSNAPQARRRVAVLAVFSVIYNIPRFFEYESVHVCVAVNTTREVFEISAFGSNRLYRIIYANVLYFVVIHGGPLLLIAFFNVKLMRRLGAWIGFASTKAMSGGDPPRMTTKRYTLA